MSRKILHQWKAEAFWCCSSFHQVFQGSQYCFESWEHLENKPFSSFANKSWIWFVTSIETPESFHFSKPLHLASSCPLSPSSTCWLHVSCHVRLLLYDIMRDTVFHILSVVSSIFFLPRQQDMPIPSEIGSFVASIDIFFRLCIFWHLCIPYNLFQNDLGCIPMNF